MSRISRICYRTANFVGERSTGIVVTINCVAIAKLSYDWWRASLPSRTPQGRQFQKLGSDVAVKDLPKGETLITMGSFAKFSNTGQWLLLIALVADLAKFLSSEMINSLHPRG